MTTRATEAISTPTPTNQRGFSQIITFGLIARGRLSDGSMGASQEFLCYDAASRADGEDYFGQFSHDAVFLGTDPAERWALSQFRDYAMPYFDRGVGWTYLPRPGGRHVRLSPDGGVAWFDEVLDNEKYGECRGTGVLRRDDGEWKIVQYGLSLPIPNDLTGDVVALIRAHEAGESRTGSD